ncbi:MAG: hypothetical protein RMJ17_03865 [Candidatus Aenigmarchaeota archaeon]|nr:hypothetical protein [Candidatus Aenigmarchaeota archaeon]MDW8149697.1 hypothetical protein [Candidatus Aenigmarchaeota archaeon]
MAKIVIDEPCLTLPIVINYVGPKPENVYFEMRNLLKRIFGVEDKHIEERELRWDRSSAEEKFSSTFFVSKPLTEVTYIFVEIKIDGSTKPSKEFEREGRVSILIDPRIKNSVVQSSLMAGLFGFIYRRQLEAEVQKYKDECREIIKLLESDLKNFLGIRV